MRQATVIIIGGGATGVGILRDLSMRGIKALLVEQKDLAYGTSSRFHGLLHSGARYAVKDAESAQECIDENYILKKIAKHCVEETEGFFVRLPEDSEEFEKKWLESCADVNIPTTKISPQETLRLEPNISSRIVSAYKVPDSAIDGFRLVWQNVASARKYGGDILTYTEVTDIEVEQPGKKVKGVKTRNTLTGRTEYIACDFIVNAAGSWVGQIAKMAGITVNVQPDKGLLIAFNHRFTSRVINRLRPASDGDIFVPHGSITIYGTTSSPAERPDDTVCQTEEVLKLLKIGQPLFENLYNYRILRVFSGTRPLYSADSASVGRAASRNFVIIDHSQEGEGLEGMATIVGGKFTTYRLMAEKMSDLVCAKLKVNAACKTAAEPLITEPAQNIIKEAKRFFPANSINRTVSRLGENFEMVVKKLEKDTLKRQIICECEMVTLAEIEIMAADPTSYNLEDVRRKTRMGMGTCQGSFCAFRTACIASKEEFFTSATVPELLKSFTQARWRGIRPALWANQIREAELMRGIYGALLNIDGEVSNEGNKPD